MHMHLGYLGKVEHRPGECGCNTAGHVLKSVHGPSPCWVRASELSAHADFLGPKVLKQSQWTNRANPEAAMLSSLH